MNETALSQTPAPAPPESTGGRWYIVHAYSNFEHQVADRIRERIGDKVNEVMVPLEEVEEVRQGKKRITKRKFFPGYVLIKAKADEKGNLDPDVLHFIKNLPRVTGFLGADDSPLPVPQAEVDRILLQVKEGAEKPRPSVQFEVGEQIQVADGPFASFNGVVEEVDVARARLKVSVSIFGRSTPVELEYGQVEKS